MSRMRLQRPEAQLQKVGVERLAFRHPVRTLTATSQHLSQPFHRVPVQFGKRLARVAQPEVCPPAEQPVAHFRHRFFDILEVAATVSQLPELGTSTRQRLLRGKHIEIASSPTKTVGIVSQREPEEAQTRTRLVDLYRPRLFAVDR